MKKEIHPQYFTNTVITCACGRTLQTGSTVETIHIELCSACHPFYTGKQKLVDTARRVEKFQSRVSRKETVAATRKGKKVKRAKKAALRQAQGEQAEEKAAEAKEEAPTLAEGEVGIPTANVGTKQ